MTKKSFFADSKTTNDLNLYSTYIQGAPTIIDLDLTTEVMARAHLFVNVCLLGSFFIFEIVLFEVEIY